MLAPVADDRAAQLIDAAVPVTEPDAAVIVTTSGSTGDPKQVVLSASAIRASASAFRQRYGAFKLDLVLGAQHVAGLMVQARDPARPPLCRWTHRHLDRADPAGAGAARAFLGRRTGRLRRGAGGGSGHPPALLDQAEAAGIAVLTSYGMSETCGGVAFNGSPLPGADIAIGDDGRIDIGEPDAVLRLPAGPGSHGEGPGEGAGC